MKSPLKKAAQVTSLPAVTREDAREFAQRTLKNLVHIKRAFESHEDVHLVTQLANSLLGLVVFPWEKDAIAPVATSELVDLARAGWPAWNIYQDDDTKEKTTNLGRLAYHLRNAVAHRRVSFSSDQPALRDVVLHVHDRKNAKAPIYWRASINAEHLLDFCERLAGFIDEELA